MITLRKKDEVLFKNFSFLFILFPFISHIYSAVFPMIYDFEISRISLVIIFSSLIISLLDKSQSWHKITWNKDLNYFLPFLVVSYASSMHNFDLYVTKYLAYIFIYFYCIRKYFLHDHIFKLYVHILVISFYLLLLCQCVCCLQSQVLTLFLLYKSYKFQGMVFQSI